MTTYTFNFNPTSYNSYVIQVSWGDPTVWTGGVVPNSPDADVDIPVISPFIFEISINSGSQFSIRSLTMSANYLDLVGSLTVSGAADLEGEVDFDAGTLTAGSLVVDGPPNTRGSGEIDVGSLTVDTAIVGNGLVVDADSLTNNGQLTAALGNLTVSVDPGSFTNLANGTLTGGAYQVGELVTDRLPILTILYLNVGELITSDAANIELVDYGTIDSYDPVAERYDSIETTLTTIASTGALTLVGGFYDWGNLTDYGALNLSADATLASTGLTIAAGGQLDVIETQDGGPQQGNNKLAYCQQR